MEDFKQTSDTNIVDEGPTSHTIKKSHNGVILIPRPSDDPLDPLNWPMTKKLRILAVISLAAFTGFAACLAGQLQVVPQSKLYKVTTNQMAYQNSAASAGMAAGGFFFFPLSQLIGRSSAIFWSLVGTLLSQVWASQMTHHGDFNSFIVSRFFGGFFGSITGVLGPRVVVDLFFLNQRGRACTVFFFWFDFGTVAGPTLSALISANTNWTNAYKWTAGLVGFALITVFLFLHETSWDRTPGAANPTPPTSFFANRIATFFPGNSVTPKTTLVKTMKVAATPFKIGFSPVILVLSVFTLVHFGFYVAMNSLSPVFLQKPVSAGGYGFTVLQNAEFSFTHWVGILIALIYGQLVSDRLPLYICSRYNHGAWKPEFRLHALWIPSLIFNPLGLGLFGAGLQYHLSWGILALGQVFVTFGSLAITPITVNYAVECFTRTPAETSIAVNVYRVGFGLSVAFYIKQWVARVDVGWAYGMMALFEVVSFGCVGLLMWKGHEIRGWTWGGLSSSEEGEYLLDERKNDGL